LNTSSALFLPTFPINSLEFQWWLSENLKLKQEQYVKTTKLKRENKQEIFKQVKNIISPPSAAFPNRPIIMWSK
jgi:hypothetical protein